MILSQGVYTCWPVLSVYKSDKLACHMLYYPKEKSELWVNIFPYILMIHNSKTILQCTS